MAVLLGADVTAPRVRAAWAFSRLEQDELAKKAGIEASRMKRLAARTNPFAATAEERHAIARACGVPPAFMEEGFARYEEEVTLADRVAALEAEVFREAADALGRAVDGADAEGGKQHSTREETQP